MTERQPETPYSLWDHTNVAVVSMAAVTLLSSVGIWGIEAAVFGFPASLSALLGIASGMATTITIGVLPIFAAVGLTAIKRLPTRAGKWLGALVAGVLLGAPFKWVGDALVAGDWAAQQSWAEALPWALLTGACLGIFLLVRVWLGDSYKRVIAAVFGAAGLAMIVGDIVALPSLYPIPHLALRTTGLVLTVLAVWDFRLSLFPRLRVSKLEAPPAWILVGALIFFWVGMPQMMTTELSFRGGVATNLTSFSLTEPDPATPVREVIEAEIGWAERSPSPDIDKPKHVVLLLVDTMRADALSPGREEKGSNNLVKATDTPFLNAFMSDKCTVFRNAYAQATATAYSLPPTFRSIQTWESAARNGRALGTRLNREGISTYAVVSGYFVHHWSPLSEALLNGFEDLGFYDYAGQTAGIGLAKDAFDRNLKQDKPSFGWLHFMALHYPGWDGEKILTKMKPGPRYVKSIRWLDSALEELIKDLEVRGALQDTTIIIASDHGEGLGDNGIRSHGPNVWEEELRVPLAICMPGQPGVIVESTVGNIDLIPTISELMGLPLDTYGGHSLVPLLVDPKAEWDYPYYSENHNKELFSMIYRGEKLQFRPKNGAYSRYNLARDPDEETNLYRPGSNIDRQLQLLMMHWNPSLLSPNVTSESAPGIAEALKEWNGTDWNPKLNLYLELGKPLRDPAIRDAVTQVWKNAKSDNVRFWIMRSMRSKKWLAPLVQARIDTPSPERLEFMRLAAEARVGSLDSKWLIKSALAVPTSDEPLWIAWMHLLAAANVKPNQVWSQGLADVLKKGRTFESQRAQDASIWPLDSLKGNRPHKVLVAELIKVMDSKSVESRARAVQSLGHTKAKEAIPHIRAALQNKDTPLMVKRRAVFALARLHGKSSNELIRQAMLDDEFVFVDGVKAIGITRDLETLRKLRKDIKRGNPLQRYVAREIKRVGKKKSKKKSKKK